MLTTYAQKQAPAQKKDAKTTASVVDNSSQRESLQRKAALANNAAIQLARGKQGKGRNKINAGAGNAWHVHYGSHIKFANEKRQKVCFSKGVSRYDTVIDNLKTNYNVADVGALRNKDAGTWDQCNSWLNDNLK